MGKRKTAFGSSAAGALGGKARAENLSKSSRAQIAREAALARWQKEGKLKGPVLPRATHGGPTCPVRIGGAEIQCYVLEDGRRVIAQRGLKAGLGFNATGGARRLTKFAHSLGAKPETVKDLTSRINSPIKFRTQMGAEGHGYDATLLADICDAVLEARRQDTLHPSHRHIAAQCEILVRGFANVGIIALIDEATGYQDDRPRDALAKILEAFIAKELQKWVRTFPTEFYEGLFKLWKVPFDPAKLSGKRPMFFAHLTDNIVYQRLAPGVREALRQRNPPLANGRRAHKNFQYLTPDLGHPKLVAHLASVITLQRVAKTKEDFWRMLNIALPKQIDMPLFDKPGESGGIIAAVAIANDAGEEVPDLPE